MYNINAMLYRIVNTERTNLCIYLTGDGKIRAQRLTAQENGIFEMG